MKKNIVRSVFLAVTAWIVCGVSGCTTLSQPKVSTTPSTSPIASQLV